MDQRDERVGTRLLPAFMALASSQLLGTAAGFVYWVLAARTAPASAVGTAGAVVATVALLVRFTSLGLGSFFLAELPSMGYAGARRVVRAGTLALVCVSVPVGLLWWGGTRLLAADDSALRAGVGTATLGSLFVLLLVTTTLCSAWDFAAIGMSRSSAQVTRNVVVSLGRFPLLLAWPALVGDVDATALLCTWLLPMVVSAVVLAVQVRLLAGRREDGPPARRLLATHARTSVGHYLLDVSLAAGPLLVPLVAAAVLVPREHGFFTVAWMAASVVFVAPFALGTALFASSAGMGEPEYLRRSRRVLPAGLALSSAGILGTWLLGGWFFLLFGEEYVDESLPIMSVLVLAGLAMVVKDVLLDWLRLARRFRLATGLALGASASEVVGALLGGAVGGDGTGVALGWVAASAVQLLVAAPLLVRFLRAMAAVRAEGAPLP